MPAQGDENRPSAAWASGRSACGCVGAGGTCR